MRRQSSTLPCSSTRQSPKSQTENRRALSSHTHPQIHSQCKTGSQRWYVEAVTRVQAIRTSISLTKSQIKLSLRRLSLKERAESQPLCPMISSASFHAMLQRWFNSIRRDRWRDSGREMLRLRSQSRAQTHLFASYHQKLRERFSQRESSWSLNWIDLTSHSPINSSLREESKAVALDWLKPLSTIPSAAPTSKWPITSLALTRSKSTLEKRWIKEMI